ncbi:MAG: LysR family transcriptional regulator [Polyangiales bacterium]
MDWNDVEVFVKVVDAGGVSAAARALGLPKSTVSRRLARLEGALGVRLLQRTSRAQALTEAGRAYHARVAAAFGELASAGTALERCEEVPRGTLRLTAPPDLAAPIADVVVGFTSLHPEVTVEVELSNRFVDLVAEGFDLAIRAGRLRDSSLVAKKLLESKLRLYASPAYLEARGVPRTLRDLEKHEAVMFRPKDGKVRWPLVGPKGKTVSVEMRGRVGCSDFGLVRQVASAGAGVALMPEAAAAPDLASGLLVPVLPEWSGDGGTMSLVYPTARLLPLRVRAFRDYALETFPGVVKARAVPSPGRTSRRA